MLQIYELSLHVTVRPLELYEYPFCTVKLDVHTLVQLFIFSSYNYIVLQLKFASIQVWA